MDLIKQYIIGLTNLYGQVSVELVTEIYNDQNEEQLSVDDVEGYFDEDMSKYYVCWACKIICVKLNLI